MSHVDARVESKVVYTTCSFHLYKIKNIQKQLPSILNKLRKIFSVSFLTCRSLLMAFSNFPSPIKIPYMEWSSFQFHCI